MNINEFIDCLIYGSIYLKESDAFTTNNVYDCALKYLKIIKLEDQHAERRLDGLSGNTQFFLVSS